METLKDLSMLPLRRRIILDLYGGTGAWSRPYAEAGYDVRVVTLPFYPLFDNKPGDVNTFEPPAIVYGILAAPPCNQFSLARQNAKAVADFAAGMEIVNACLHIIWKCRLMGKLQFWALENPVGYLRQFIGKPPYRFEHWEFGDNAYKPTDIWGYFNFPKKTIKQRPTNLRPLKDVNGRNRRAIRAITPPGFAKAFFKANQ